jgi:hypothetical protein
MVERKEYYTLSYKNSYGCDLGTEYCKTKEDMLRSFSAFLEASEPGDTIEFGVVDE